MFMYTNKSQTIFKQKVRKNFKDPDNFHYVFINKKLHTFCYTMFHNVFEWTYYIEKTSLT